MPLQRKSDHADWPAYSQDALAGIDLHAHTICLIAAQAEEGIRCALRERGEESDVTRPGCAWASEDHDGADGGFACKTPSAVGPRICLARAGDASAAKTPVHEGCAPRGGVIAQTDAAQIFIDARGGARTGRFVHAKLATRDDKPGGCCGSCCRHRRTVTRSSWCRMCGGSSRF